MELKNSNGTILFNKLTPDLQERITKSGLSQETLKKFIKSTTNSSIKKQIQNLYNQTIPGPDQVKQ